MNKKAQITMEASFIFAIVAAGLLVMRGYLARSIQGSWKTNADSFSEEQYRPATDELLGGEIDPNPTTEIEAVPQIIFEDPVMTAKTFEGGEDKELLGSLDIATGARRGGVVCDDPDPDKCPAILEPGILQIKDWGTYRDTKEHEDE